MIKEILSLVNLSQILNFINPFCFTKNFSFKKLDYFHVPTIAEYKIVNYDNEKVTFFFFDVHPFMCPYCKIMMDIQEIYVSSDWYGRTIHKMYF